MSSDDANSADRYQINLYMVQPGFVLPSNKDQTRAEETSEAKFLCLRLKRKGKFLAVGFEPLIAELHKSVSRSWTQVCDFGTR